MNKLDKITLSALLAVGLFAGASLTTQAAESLINSKDALISGVIATPGKATVSGQPVNRAAYSSKTSLPTASSQQAASKTKASAQPVNASAYSSKAR